MKDIKMHSLLVADYYPNVINLSNIDYDFSYEYNWNSIYKTDGFFGGIVRNYHHFDDDIYWQAINITGAPISRHQDHETYMMQLNFYDKGSYLYPHIDEDINHSILIQMYGSKEITFYRVNSDLCNEYFSPESPVIESITMAPGDLVHIDMEASRNQKIGHGVAICREKSVTAVLRD